MPEAVSFMHASRQHKRGQPQRQRNIERWRCLVSLAISDKREPILGFWVAHSLSRYYVCYPCPAATGSASASSQSLMLAWSKMDPAPTFPVFRFLIRPSFAMALTLAGAHVAVGPLLSGCYNIVKGINKLHQSYKFMPLTLSSIVMTCNTTSSTLKQVNSTLENHPGALREPYQELFEQFDGIKIGCTMTLSLLEKHVADMLDIGDSDVPLKAQMTSKTDKLKALYNESDMKELFGQLKDYNALLNTILNHLQRYDDSSC